MWKKIGNSLSASYAWMIRRPAYMMLTANDERFSREAPDRFTGSWIGLLLLSAAWGVASGGIYVTGWRLFGDYNNIIMPPVLVATVLASWPFRKALVALSEIIAGRDATARAVIAAVLVVLLTMCLIRLRSDPHLSEYPLWWLVAWIRPSDVLYRVLLLMPLWGAWAMMVTCQFSRPGEATSPAVAAFARGCGAMTTAIVMGVLMGISILYFASWWRLSVSAAAILTGVIGGLIVSRRTGGLKRNTLLAVNLLTQIAFLLAYLAS